MKILFVADVIGRGGRRALRELLPAAVESEGVDFVVANGENAAGGFGLTPSVARQILDAGVHVMTGGNHLWDKRGTEDYLDGEPLLARPANYPPGTPGRRWVISF